MIEQIVCGRCGKDVPFENKRISAYIDNLLTQSFDGWSNESKNAYILGLETLRHAELVYIRPVTYEDFFIKTKGTYIECEEPTIEPSYISTPTQVGNTASKYWYGTDKGGDYIIRKANHWCIYYSKGDKQSNVIITQCSRIVKCTWHFQFNRVASRSDVVFLEQHYTGKVYLKDLRHK